MTELVQKVVCKSMSTLQRNMSILFNNPELSDTTFIIQGSKMYAWSGLVSVASPTLGSLINDHFTNCDDREITLRGIKYEESFTTILKHMYGLDIELEKVNVSVICEALALSETYKLTDINKDLKDYLSLMKSFSLDSAVILLNTASKYDMPDLYKQLTIFAYQNAEQLVKHESFHNMQYNVLLELIKSDRFYCEEIDLLKGVLTWHTDMSSWYGTPNACRVTPPCCLSCQRIACLQFSQ
uniref:BTB/POZ domain-containing protein 9 n=1 Tax=Cacopsylla melanoneura TaxID=428564 RepID=A0A8D9E3I2_9HEMI